MKHDIRYGLFHEGRQDFMKSQSLRDWAKSIEGIAKKLDLMEEHKDHDVAIADYLIAQDLIVYIKGDTVYSGTIPWREYGVPAGEIYAYWPVVPMVLVRKHCEPLRESQFLYEGRF